MKHMDENKKSGMLNKVLSLIAVATVFTMVGTGIGATAMQTNALAEATPQAEEIDTADYSASPAVAVYEKCSESVVGVITYSESYSRATGNVEKTEVGEGSGIVISDDGYILTNNHVIADGNYYEALLSSGDKVEAELVGADSGTDIAVLHVEGQTLKAIEIGTSTDLKVGETVIAIGNPGGYYGTVSVGVVSALERDIEEFARPMAIIQTDAAMSPGISGGALLNSRGELVGIPSLGVILYEGLNFAIPVNTMKEVAAELIEHGKVRKPGIGIYYTVQDGPDEPLKNYLPAGLLVAEVGVDTPAERGGMRVGDVIYAIEGERVKSGRDLMVAMQGYDAGDEVVFTVYRFSYEDRDLDENFLDITLTLEYIN